jgi:hypothetical protein
VWVHQCRRCGRLDLDRAFGTFQEAEQRALRGGVWTCRICGSVLFGLVWQRSGRSGLPDALARVLNARTGSRPRAPTNATGRGWR